MLSSIHSNLNDEGVLFIHEKLSEFGPAGCNSQLTEEEFINSVDSTLFKIVERKKLENSIIFKMKKAS